MSPTPTFFRFLKKEFLNPYSIISIITTSLIYFSFSVLLLNLNLVFVTIFGQLSLMYKLNLLTALVLGSFQALGALNSILLIITSILVGINLVTVFKNLKRLKNFGGKLTVSAGGSAVIGIFVAGCSTCGFSVFALVGLTSAVTLFPFEGLLIGLIIIALLVFSLAYSLKTLYREIFCKI